MSTISELLRLSTVPSFVVAAACLSMAAAQTTATSVASVPGIKITTIPAKLDRACRSGRASLYDECSDQLSIFALARKRAGAENKVLLVSYGAEWCIWCHVFAKYIHGEKTQFKYTYGFPDATEVRETATLYEREKSDVTSNAAALSDYAGRSFVVVHIDARYAPNGRAVLARAGAPSASWLPYIFTVDKNGRYAAHLVHERVEVRRDTADWYRGYDRRKLLAELQRLHAAASR